MSEQMVRIYNRMTQAIPVNVRKQDGSEETCMLEAKGHVDRPKALVDKSPNVKAMTSPKKGLIVVKAIQ